MFKKIKNGFLLTISLATLCGMLAGVCGAILVRSYVFNDDYSPYSNQELNLNDLNNVSRSGLVIRDPKKVVVNQDVKVEETINSFSSSLVGVFKEMPQKNNTETNASDYYSLDKPAFIGLIVTSDGWVMSSLSDDMKDLFNSKSYVVVSSDRKTYKIDKINLIKGLPGDVIFFHLEGAVNLPVRKIVPRSDLSLGQSLIIFDKNYNVWPTNLASFKKTPDILSSDYLNARLVLANNPESVQKNSFIFNLSGDLTAVVDSDKEIIPAFSYSNYWRGFSSKQTVLNPFLGLSYLDLSLVKIANITINKGALIYSNGKTAVIKNSPADLAGLLPGDIVTWVNNQEISSNDDLADLIAKYKPGEKITLTYLRGDQEKQVDVKLGELK